MCTDCCKYIHRDWCRRAPFCWYLCQSYLELAFQSLQPDIYSSTLCNAGADHTSLEVETLLGRVADGVVVEDRREALAILSELLHNSIQVWLTLRIGATLCPGREEQALTLSSPQAQQIIGMNGLSVLCGVLRDEKGDKEMLRGALECLSVALTPSPVRTYAFLLMSAVARTGLSSNAPIYVHRKIKAPYPLCRRLAICNHLAQ